jgi:hypothetical protein
MLRRLSLLVVLAATATFAQTGGGPSSAKSYYKVGDPLRYTVVFDGDPNFSTVTLYFTTSASSPEQAGLRQDFSINQTKRLAPGRFQVQGTIPNDIMTGTYQLVDVQPRIAPNGVKDYDAKRFQQLFQVDNPAKYRFPPLKNVESR